MYIRLKRGFLGGRISNGVNKLSVTYLAVNGAWCLQQGESITNLMKGGRVNDDAL